MSIFLYFFFNFNFLLIILSESKRFFLKLYNLSFTLLLTSFTFFITTFLFPISTIPKIILKHPPKKLFFTKIEQRCQIIMLIFSNIIEQPIVIFLHDTQMLTNLYKLIRVGLSCLQSHIFLFKDHEHILL